MDSEEINCAESGDIIKLLLGTGRGEIVVSHVEDLLPSWRTTEEEQHEKHVQLQ